VHGRFKQLLHQYKLDVFKMQHDKQDIAQITNECMTICDEVLNQKYHYHFHKLPDANRAEIINMISNYTREALLPPVVEQIVRRQVTLEHRVEAMEKFLEQMLETLSENPVTAT
jgi:hypothetical protein